MITININAHKKGLPARRLVDPGRNGPYVYAEHFDRHTQDPEDSTALDSNARTLSLRRAGITATDTATSSITGVSGSIMVAGGVGQANGILNGYSAKTGYDLATGLGSVNANKVVNSTAW